MDITQRRFGIMGERTNWVKTYADFDKMSPADRAARFSDPDGVEKILLTQARNQRLRMIGAGVGAATIAHAAGVDDAILKKIAAVVH